MKVLETGLNILSHNKGENDAPPSSPDINEGAERNGFINDASDSDEHDDLNPAILFHEQDMQEDSLSSEEGPHHDELWRYHAEQFRRVLEALRPEIDDEMSEMDTSSEHSLEFGFGINDELNSDHSDVQQHAQYVNILSPSDDSSESTLSSNSSLSSMSSQSSMYDA